MIAVAHRVPARRFLPALVLAGLLLSAGVAAAEHPNNNERPSITGPNPPAVNSVLTGHNGSWIYADGSSCGSECSYTWEWRRCRAGTEQECAVSRPDSVDRTYVVQAVDVGLSVVLAVTAHKYDCNAHGVDCRWVARTATSAPTAPVGGTAAAPAGGTVAAVLTIGPGSLADAVAGSAYHQTLTASGGSGPYAFSVGAGSLPPGLTLGSDGVLSGTPSLAGTFSFTARATGSAGAVGTQAFTLRVDLALGPGSLPDGVTGVTYSQQLNVAAGGSAPFAFRVVAGELPAGLELSTSGLLAGTPTRSGIFAFTVEASDARGATGRARLAVRVAWPTLSFQTEVRPAVSDRQYRQRLVVSGGSAPYAWELAQGAMLPAGLELRRDGVLRGRPSAPAGTFMFDVIVTDRFGASGRATFTLELKPALVLIRPTGLAPATQRRSYSATLRAGGGKAPYRFSRAGGRLPAGLRLSPDGRLAGVPVAAGVFRFVVRAVDANGAAQTRTYVLLVKRA